MAANGTGLVNFTVRNTFIELSGEDQAELEYVQHGSPHAGARGRSMPPKFRHGDAQEAQEGPAPQLMGERPKASLDGSSPAASAATESPSASPAGSDWQGERSSPMECAPSRSTVGFPVGHLPGELRACRFGGAPSVGPASGYPASTSGAGSPVLVQSFGGFRAAPPPPPAHPVRPGYIAPAAQPMSPPPAYVAKVRHPAHPPPAAPPVFPGDAPPLDHASISLGSRGHGTGACRPCAFTRAAAGCNWAGCKFGADCHFCHVLADHPEAVRVRPCKGKRERLKRQIDSIGRAIAQDPDLFASGDFSLPALVDGSSRVRSRVMAHLAQVAADAYRTRGGVRGSSATMSL